MTEHPAVMAFGLVAFISVIVLFLMAIFNGGEE